MSALQKLDDVLGWFPSNHDYIPFNKLQERYVVETMAGNGKIAGIELISIVELLIEDGYVEKGVKDANWHGGNPITQITENQFKLTFKGAFWIERGAYRGDWRRSERAEKRDQEYHHLTIVLTVWGVVVGVAAIVQCYLFYEDHNLSIPKAAYFGSGALLALALWITIKELMRLLRSKRKHP